MLIVTHSLPTHDRKDMEHVYENPQEKGYDSEIFEDKRTQASMLKTNDVFEVRCSPLHAMVANAGYASIDFMSLDVEGAEELVLSTVDPRIFGMVLVEANSVLGKSCNVPRKDCFVRDARVDYMLQRAGMRRAQHLDVGWRDKLFNHVYVRDDLYDACVAPDTREMPISGYHMRKFPGVGASAPLAASRPSFAGRKRVVGRR